MSLWIPLSANYIYTVTSCSYPAGIGLFTYICTYTHTHICIYTVMGVWPLYKGILYKFRYIYIYIYIYIYYIDVYSSMYVYKCTQDTCGLSHMSVCRHVGILIYIYMYTCTGTHICLCICVYHACMCTYVYICI